MSSLVQYATSDTGIRGVGVFIREIPPPGTVRSAAQGVVGFVGEYPWGPTDAAYEPTSGSDLLDVMFGPAPLDHKAFRAFRGKRFGRVICSRVIGSDAAASSVTVGHASSSPVASIVATARYPGAVGDNIQIIITANATTSGNRDVTVRFRRVDGSTYEAKYQNVQVTGTFDVTDPGDPHVVFSKASGTLSGVALAGTYNLGQAVAGAVTARVQGADGSVTGASYTAAVDRLGGASSAVRIVCPLEPTSAISDGNLNGALYTFSGANPDKIVLLKTAAGESVSDAITDAASYRNDNVVKLWPRVYQRHSDATGNLVSTVCDGNAFLASILANTDPWISPGSKEGTSYTGEILALENQTIGHDAYANLTEGGVSAWFMSTKNGAMIRGAVSTSLDTAINRIRRRRYTSYLSESLAGFLEDYVDSPLDLDLTSRELGPNTTAQIAAMRQFLREEQSGSRLIDFDVDPFEAMTPTKFSAGRWDVVVRVRDVPGAEQIVLRLQAGPSVQID